MTINGKNVLLLTLKKEWFQMILSGEKKQEYRTIKPYWIKRLAAAYNSHYTGLVGEDYEKKYFFKHFDYIKFENGYGSKVPSMLIEFKSIEIGQGNPEWGGTKEEVFILNLGEIIETKNC